MYAIYRSGLNFNVKGLESGIVFRCGSLSEAHRFVTVVCRGRIVKEL